MIHKWLVGWWRRFVFLLYVLVLSKAFLSMSSSASWSALTTPPPSCACPSPALVWFGFDSSLNSVGMIGSSSREAAGSSFRSSKCKDLEELFFWLYFSCSLGSVRNVGSGHTSASCVQSSSIVVPVTAAHFLALLRPLWARRSNIPVPVIISNERRRRRRRRCAPRRPSSSLFFHFFLLSSSSALEKIQKTGN